MVEKSLVEKIQELCEKDGENFSKGKHLVIRNIKLKYYFGGSGSERVRVIEGQKKVFDYVKLIKYENFEWIGNGNWESIIEERYSFLNREY